MAQRPPPTVSLSIALLDADTAADPAESGAHVRDTVDSTATHAKATRPVRTQPCSSAATRDEKQKSELLTARGRAGSRDDRSAVDAALLADDELAEEEVAGDLFPAFSQGPAPAALSARSAKGGRTPGQRADSSAGLPFSAVPLADDDDDDDAEGDSLAPALSMRRHVASQRVLQLRRSTSTAVSRSPSQPVSSDAAGSSNEGEDEEEGEDDGPRVSVRSRVDRSAHHGALHAGMGVAGDEGTLADVQKLANRTAAGCQSWDPAVERSWAAALWPHPAPPTSAEARPRDGQSRVAFHSQRYGEFVRRYIGLSDAEVQRAQRRARGICVIGVNKHQSKSRGATSTLVKAARTFLRHAVLAVEGDAVFSELMERAEMLYAVEVQRAQQVAQALTALDGPRNSSGAAADTHRTVQSPLLPAGVRWPCAAPHAPTRLPRVSENRLRANARCIALHYGLPEHAQRHGGGADRVAGQPAEADGSRQDVPYSGRATLMAVVSTTRLEEGEEVYVSLESFYRCLDEVSWHRRRYGSAPAADGQGPSAHHNRTPATADRSSGSDNSSNSSNPIVGGDVHTGVKHFLRWPRGLRYYHGVGSRHSSGVAAAAFPFTLLDLAPAPELGEHELGVVAASPIPYATCFLYTGPSVTTTHIEKLVQEAHDGVERGTVTADGPPRGTAGDLREAEQDALDFALDDTYALGLGRRAVCFGQGVARYINHRYNLSRFGNVELCSLMLSVPSGFAAPSSSDNKRPAKRAGRTTCGPHRAKKAAGGKRGRRVAASPSLSAATVRSTLNQSSRTHPPSDGAGRGEEQDDEAAAGRAPVGARRHPSRRPPPRRRCMFFEEQSHFVTLPFFITTTDTEPGTPLLAWTYGEEYDAKLERVAVADGALVPYRDGALLNARLAAATAPPTGSVSARPPRQWQRYGGDYRFAINVGDVVWRRRPSREAGPGGRGVAERGSVPCGCGCGARCPPPQDDLFVVLQLMKDSMEWVLLLPLARESATPAELLSLLRAEGLLAYRSSFSRSGESPAAPGGGAEAKPDVGADGEDVVSVILGARLHARSASRSIPARSRTRPSASPSASQARDAATEAWAAFSTRLSSRSAYMDAEKALHHCLVAGTDSLALLLPDLDYTVVRTSTGPSRKVHTAGEGRWHGPADSSIVHRIIVNLHDLQHNTALVRCGKRACAVPPLLSGLMWPLLRRQPGALGFDCMYAPNKRNALH